MSKFIIIILFSALTACASSIVIVDNGQARAVIKYAKKNAPEGHQAYKTISKSSEELAKIMQDYLKKVSGALLKTGPNISGNITIHIGMTDYAEKLKYNLKNMAEDEFIISFPDEKNIVIIGAYQNGIEWGVMDFIERYAGVKLLFPGPLGEHIPHMKTIVVPMKEIRDKPIFLYRHFTINNHDKEQKKFMRFYRDRSPVRFHHAMGYMVNPVNPYNDPKKFPHFYPIQHGKRMIPTKKNMFIGWQPCFTAKGLVETMAPRVAKVLKRRSNSVSLGINDNGGFCECEQCKKQPNHNYYNFCNKIASMVTPKMGGQDYKIGLLGGYGGITIPEVKLDDHLVPFVTSETFTWLNPEKQKSVKKEIADWKKKCKNLGWYDYIYGGRYLMPRIFFRHHAKVLRYLAKNNVRYYYAEMGFDKHFKEGPKGYLTMKMLWNPYLDVDKELNAWYEAAVGKKAAPFLKEYFECWENFWTKTVPGSSWFKNNKDRTYMRYYDNSYLGDIDAKMLKKVGVLLDKVVAKAKKPLEKKRAEMFRKQFRENAVVVKWYMDNKILDKNKSKLRLVSTKKEDFKNKKIWGHWRHPASRAEARWDSKGNGSMLIDKSKDAFLADPGTMVFTKIIRVKPGEIYKISARVMVQDVEPGAMVELGVRWRDKKLKNWINFMTMWNIVKITPTPGKWSNISVLVRAPKISRVGGMHIMLGTGRAVKGGKFWFDDIVISKLKTL